MMAGEFGKTVHSSGVTLVVTWSSEATKFLLAVILTTSSEDQNRLRGYGLGANSFVRKPVQVDRFIKAVCQLVLYRLILNESAPVPRRA